MPRTSIEKVLLVHNRYRARGGEDVVFESEARLLEQRGHRVTTLVVDNADIPSSPTPDQRLRLALGTIWSRSSAAAVGDVVRRVRPDVVHVHNTLPLLSPSIYEAVTAEGIPVVQTLHNFRLICPVATLFRNGKPCHDCVGRKVPWPSVVHACYRGSHSESAVVAAMLAFHNARGTWHHVSAFIALTESGRRTFIEGGLPPERIFVKPNFIEPDPGSHMSTGSGFLFVGRLTPEKGIGTLLGAWEVLPNDVTLTIVGDGPLRGEVEAAAQRDNVSYLGALDREAVLGAMRSAAALIVPSVWYEGAPLNIIEAFACGLPVIGSRLGAIEEAVEPGRNGLLFEPGDAASLAAEVLSLSENAPQNRQMSKAARDTYLRRYSGETNYGLLLAIYERIGAKEPPHGS